MNITFFWQFATAFALTVFIGKFLIPELHKWHFGQSIRECGPKEHLKKGGTPTMGGIMMILAVIAANLLWNGHDRTMYLALWLLWGTDSSDLLTMASRFSLNAIWGLRPNRRWPCRSLLLVSTYFTR